MSIRNKQVKRAQVSLTKEQREAAVRSISEMFPSDFEWVAKALVECIEIEKLEEGWCFNCDGPGKLRVPDYRTRLKTLELLIAHKIGKPTERRHLEVTGTVTHELAQMSDEDLAREIARAEADVEEGEWKELPPAA